MLNIYNRENRTKVAVLQNAHDVVEREVLNGVSELDFALPGTDEKNKHCIPFHYVRWENGALYRLLDSDSTLFADGAAIRYQCEHVIATLIDDVIFGTLQLDNLPTRQVLERILSMQTERLWQLGNCEFDRQFSYNWSNENLLVALFSVPNRFEEDYIWTFETDMYPWTVHLRKLDQTLHPQYYIREGRNLLAAEQSVKGRDICTRLYPLGYGEGVNQLTIKDVNGGVPYLDADEEAVAKYGIVTRIWEDSRFEQAQSLYERAKVLLDGYSKPYECYSVSVADLDKMTGEAMDRAEVGKIVWYEGFKSYITRVERHLTEVGQDTVEIANTPEDIAGSIADLADRQRINSVYAQGATNIYAMRFGDNANASNPATISFYVPSEAKQINKVILSWSYDRFRASSTGASTTSSESRTTEGGGGNTYTSSSGGGDSKTSGPSSVTTIKLDANPSDSRNEFTSRPQGESSIHQHIYTLSPTAHTHNIDHTHRVDIPAHSHSVVIPNHSHQFTIPGHTHALIYGIYEGPRATSATLRVDGMNVPLAAGQTEIDVVQYLSVDSSGKIRRGTHHSIEIIPNSLTRISATLTVQLFIQSEGGGNY